MRITSLKLNSLRDLYVEELRDLHDAETQLVKALPKMAEAATGVQLKAAFNTHLGQTKVHVNRLEEIFRQLDERPTGETCRAMKGLIEEGKEFIDADGDAAVRDAGLIGAAQRVEHYEMAGYGTTRALAQRLGETGAAEILQQTLDEEGEADKILTDIAGHEVNLHAAH
ncbi:MAG: ferritin-like domain-containing protein [Chthoniobacteraceae bacterium]|jgi:ferritin-like metal-binding protein YciE